MKEPKMYRKTNGKVVIRFEGKWSAKDLRKRVKAFTELFGRHPYMQIMGVFDPGPQDIAKYDEFRPFTPATVVSYGTKYMIVDYVDNKFGFIQIQYPYDSPYAYHLSETYYWMEFN